MDIFLLDKYFNFIERIPAFVSFIWAGQYSRPGSFELYIPYDKELFKALKTEARYIIRQDTKKIAYIQSLKKTQNSSQGSMLILSGPFLEGVLQKYIFRGISSIAAGSLPLTDWLESSLLNIFPSGCATIDKTFGTGLNYLLNDPRILDSNAQALIFAMLNSFGVSLTHQKVGSSVVFSIWQGKDRTVSSSSSDKLLLSEKRKNIFDIEYQSSEAGCYNTVIGTGYTQLIESYRNNGLSYIYPSSINPQSIDSSQTAFEFELVVNETVLPSGITTYEVDEEASYQRFLSEAPKYITPVSEGFIAELIDPKIVALGDVVSLRDDDLGIIYDKRVEKVVESYNHTQSKIVNTFGEPIRTIRDVVTKSMGME